jgi:tetratricopeptide (TPR) repeat protein
LFGCEDAFSGERAQGIAERVFTRLAEKMPDKPQVFYLLGYLRQEQERFVEAAEDFRKAVKLDPNYFNAWKHLLECDERGAFSQDEIDAATLALLRLDPSMRHSDGGFPSVRNIRALWEGVLAAEKEAPPISRSPIYPLAASKASLDERAKAQRSSGNYFATQQRYFGEEGRYGQASPRGQFSHEAFLTSLAVFLSPME